MVRSDLAGELLTGGDLSEGVAAVVAGPSGVALTAAVDAGAVSGTLIRALRCNTVTQCSAPSVHEPVRTGAAGTTK